MCRQSTRNSSSGFTLLEIVVVILIIGVMVTFASLSIGNRALEDTLDAEARRTQAVIQLAEEEAESKGLEIGLRFTREGYQLVTVNSKKKWADYEETGPLRRRTLHEAVEMAVTVEGRRIELPEAAPDAKGNAKEGEEDERLFNRDSKKGKGKSEPQVLLLSSGEITPFVIALSAPGLKMHFEVAGDEFGTIKINRVADKKT